MTYSWKALEDKCYCCGQRVGKMSIKEGKIVVKDYSALWGTWLHIPGKAQMHTLCCVCQAAIDRKASQTGLAFREALQAFRAEITSGAKEGTP